MRAIVNYEYLLAPALAPDTDVFSRAEDVCILWQQFQKLTVPPVLEEDALISMIDAGLYPSENIYKEKFCRIEDFPFSPHDIARIVNNILESGQCLSEVEPEIITEWDEKEFTPSKIPNITEHRESQLFSQSESIAICSAISQKRYGILFFNQHLQSTLKQIEVTGNLTDIYPEDAATLPLKISETTPIFYSQSEYIQSQNPLAIYKSAQNETDFKYSYYVGAKKLSKSNGDESNHLKWDEFRIGPHFIQSLIDCECTEDHQFSETCFDTVIHLLANCPKSDLDIFTKSADSKEPRTHGNHTAYRTHVTKGGRALRLMYWKDDNNRLTLANIGNKHDLYIAPPE
ncbi:TPA: hypothetical protein L4942_003764 [Pseudomonas aeruginosa]|uniref:hypothetical protein n=1 Tax=Pseudomonas aeruginosa TaxID=287 RepID=UPI000A567943|nr:hypothetical protein [Pseudomonas aeruginosa]MBG6911304.1 hypothetical protein [Pseudomonas aeruginosa]MCS9883503.1 hypothetical protein [Pseudomonas aeruginosa]MCS9889366.1 hypothetical protein [Pseudomonas aeruginosa]MCT0160194.1 hypothetical protein [Pseudomonas aeruginosa]MCT0174055.1 hypothetical protein [Pseudomonas aeruginosa]